MCFSKDVSPSWLWKCSILLMSLWRLCIQTCKETVFCLWDVDMKMCFSIHSFLVLKQDYSWWKCISKISFLSTKSWVISFPVLDLGQGRREVAAPEALCPASCRIIKHNVSIKNRKLSFRCGLWGSSWFLEGRTPNTDLLLVCINQFWHQAAWCAQEHWTKHSDCAQCEATWSHKFFSMPAKPLSELSLIWLRQWFLTLWEYASYTAAHGTPMLEGRFLSPSVSNWNKVGQMKNRFYFTVSVHATHFRLFIANSFSRPAVTLYILWPSK